MISKYLKRIVLFDHTHMVSVTNLVVIGVETLKIYYVLFGERVY